MNNTLPLRGRREPAPIWLLSMASPKVLAAPITSPVERISGLKMGSTPGNLLKGNTASLTLKYGGVISRGGRPPRLRWFLSFTPAMQRAAILASCCPVALLTQGPVREARGFTSST